MKKRYSSKVIFSLASGIWIAMDDTAVQAVSQGERELHDSAGNSNEAVRDNTKETAIDERTADFSILQQNIANNTAEIGVVKSQISDCLNPTADMSGILICVALGLGVLASIISVIALMRTLSFDQKLSRLERLLKTNNRDTEQDRDLQKELFDLKKEFYSIKDKFNEPVSRPSTLIQSSEPMRKTQPSAVQPMPQEEPVHTMGDAYRDFVSAYNQIRSSSANYAHSQQLRKEFQNKFPILAFSCVNYQQRMDTPSLPPEFSSVGTPAKAQYWAFDLGNRTYAVVPNLKEYEESVHEAGGMGIVYESNYRAGNSYRNITVERPAIFEAGWTLRTKGKLTLS